jgi:hypothetical protein
MSASSQGRIGVSACGQGDDGCRLPHRKSLLSGNFLLCHGHVSNGEAGRERVSRGGDTFGAVHRAARDVLMRKDAVIDKLVGDEVMGLFIPLFVGEDAVKKMVEARIELLEQTAAIDLEVGAGADFGVAYADNVGEEDVRDFTALGDVVIRRPACRPIPASSSCPRASTPSSGTASPVRTWSS